MANLHQASLSDNQGCCRKYKCYGQTLPCRCTRRATLICACSPTRSHLERSGAVGLTPAYPELSVQCLTIITGSGKGGVVNFVVVRLDSLSQYLNY